MCPSVTNAMSPLDERARSWADGRPRLRASGPSSRAWNTSSGRPSQAALNTTVWPSGAKRAACSVPRRNVSWRKLGASPVPRSAVPARMRPAATARASAAAATVRMRSTRRRGSRGVSAVPPAEASPERAARPNATSRADWKRSPGLFSRQCRTMASSPGGSPGWTVAGSGGSSLRIAFMVSTAYSRRNAGRPVNIS